MFKIIFVIIVFLICCIGIYLLRKDRQKEIDRSTYIYPKTGHKYIVLDRCKLKCPVDGKWYDAFIYQGLDDSKLYVRERDDFSKKFVSNKEYENKDRR